MYPSLGEMGRDFSLPVRRLVNSYSRSIVGLVGLSTVALAAELCRLVRAGGGAARVVGSANEEHGLVEASRLAAIFGGHVHHVHNVLVVAGGAGNHSRVVVGGQADEEPVVLEELGRIRTVHRDYAADLTAVPVPLAAARDRGVQSHRVIGEVAVGTCAIAVIPLQSRNAVEGSVSGGQRFKDLVLHHCALGIVAVMAAQAGQKAINIRRGSQHVGRQSLDGTSSEG